MGAGFDVVLPHDLDAEEIVLGAAMISPEAAGLAVDALTSKHFYRPAHQVVFEAVVSLVEQSMPVSPVSVKAALEQAANGAAVDPLVLVAMTERVPVAGHPGYYLARLEDLFRRRSLVLAGRQLTDLGQNTALDAEDVAEQARLIIDRAAGSEDKTGGRSVADIIGPFLDRLESRTEDPGVTTGWVDLDGLLTKLRPSQLVVIGARPGMGKSVFMINLALHVGVKLGQPVLFASLEMSEDELMTRVVAHMAGVSLHTLQQRRLTDDDLVRIAKRTAELNATEHLILDDNPNLTIAGLRAKLAAMRRSGHPAALVCVDYLQLMTSPRRSDNRQQEVSEISRSLKLLAKDFEVPIVVGSQLNRGPEQRANKRPTKADLRESGALEQDADVVILLHREDAYEPESPRAGEIDLVVDKHRQGATATITCAFQGHYSRIADMAPEPA
jgi:replicative DNA helicase